MNFGYPYFWLLALLPLTGILFFLLKARKTKSRFLLPWPGPKEIIATQMRSTRRWFRFLFGAQLITLFILVLVSARPIRTRVETKKWTESIDILLVLDVSESMDATDFSPNRLIVAKKVIKDFIENRKNDRIGLITFGGEAITTSPLTRDYDFLLAQLEQAKTRELKQGTAIGMSLATAVARFRRSVAKSKVIILLTDGDNNVGSINPVTASHLAREEGIKIYSIGIGKDTRVIVPIYSYDMYGNKAQLIAKVPSYLNPELLKKIASITGGNAYMATDPTGLDKILSEIDRLERTRVQVTPIRREEDLFLPFALIGTFLLFLTIILLETRFRRARPKYAVSV